MLNPCFLRLITGVCFGFNKLPEILLKHESLLLNMDSGCVCQCGLFDKHGSLMHRRLKNRKDSFLTQNERDELNSGKSHFSLLMPLITGEAITKEGL